MGRRGRELGVLINWVHREHIVGYGIETECLSCWVAMGRGSFARVDRERTWCLKSRASGAKTPRPWTRDKVWVGIERVNCAFLWKLENG